MMKFLRTVSFHYKYFQKCMYHTGDKGVYGHLPILGQISSDKESKPSEEQIKNRNNHPNFYRLANAYREHGHRQAHVNPLEPPGSNNAEYVPEIDQTRYLFKNSETIKTNGILNVTNNEISLENGIAALQQIYAGQIGYEFMYIENEFEREWFAQRIEELSLSNPDSLISNDYKVQLALEMVKSQNFDHFLANKFATVKRYGGEGCETLMVLFMELLNSCASGGVDNIVLGMAHRGRLNLLAGLLKYPTVQLFRKMKGLPEFPSEARASGDVLSHLSTSVDLDVNGKNVHFIMLPNSSHLEAVNPMAVGKVRAKQKTLKDYDYADTVQENSSRVLCVQVHGDAAISGQGVNQETLGFANVPHFRTGGSIHVITNNQVGFTTPQDRGRSSRYSSDIAKMINAPVIHVNGDSPHDVVTATKLAVDYRQKFHKDIFIDLVCFRRWGHNELDDPTFTNPKLYSLIHSRQSIPDKYNEKLINEGVLDTNLLQSTLEKHNQILGENLKEIESHVPPKTYLQSQWSNIIQPQEVLTTWDTGIDVPLLKYVGVKSVEYPDEFAIHSHIAKTFVKGRISKMTNGTNIDWATAEALALGSLLYQGFDVRFSGEDVGRGTFSHRHMMLVDQVSGEIIVPLNSMLENQENYLEIANTTLSEEAVLAFEYGYSVEHPSNLCIWEAQFGDFFNGAQIILDTMVTSGETKWMLQSGLCMLLPHGMDGAGPEHSSCRIERFLQMTDSNESGKVDGDYNNFQVVNPTTPSQYFHVLRRQMVRNFRKPLVVIAPKTLLRLSAAQSTLDEMGLSTYFKPIISDTFVNPNEVKKLIFVSGKHFYTLHDKRQELKLKDTAIVRVESLCPFPVQEIKNEIEKYKNVQKIIWSQEEHQNMGAWTFIRPRFQNLVGSDISYAGRGPLAAPAVGIGQIYHQEVAKIIKDTFA